MSNHPVDIIPTTVPRNRDELLDAIHVVSRFSRKIHVDVDDGLFVPQVSWPYVGADMYGSADISGLGGISIEAHLMVRDPRMIGSDLARAGVKTIVGHIEACADISEAEKTLALWRASGAHEVGLAILIDTPVEKILPYVSLCDVVQIMSVAKVGAQGAPFDPRAIERVRILRDVFPDLVISVDGGINGSNIADLMAAGTARFAVGSAIMQTGDAARAYRQLIELTAAAHAV